MRGEIGSKSPLLRGDLGGSARFATNSRTFKTSSETRPIADLYSFNLPDAIPCFSLPLRAGDREPVIDLHALLNDVYDRSGYDYFTDYHLDPIPLLSEADAI
ncbi:MAG: DUF4058 family protein [Leptolyngbyaceae cyanobacterium RU_5_1]|nr:DUF4058 family protein [Leptolyngbyaceae cyanobacterium RU_5_1]